MEAIEDVDLHLSYVNSEGRTVSGEITDNAVVFGDEADAFFRFKLHQKTGRLLGLYLILVRMT